AGVTRRVRPTVRALLAVALAFAAGVAALAWLMTGACGTAAESHAPGAIGSCWLLPHEGARVAWRRLLHGDAALAASGEAFARRAPEPPPIGGAVLPQHPFMAAGGSNMHNDAAMSDVYAAA